MISINEAINSKIIDINKLENFRLKKLKERKQRTTTALISGISIAVLSIVLSIIFYNGWVMITGIIIAVIIFFIVRGSQLISIERNIRENLLQSFFKAVIPEMSYSTYDYISREQFEKSKFIWSYTHHSGENHFAWKLNNINVEFSELVLTETTDKIRLPVFTGPYFVIQFPDKFKGRTVVKPYSKKTTADRKFYNLLQKIIKSGDPEININDDSFHKEFKIFSTNENEAKNILSEDLRNFLLSFTANSNTEPFFSISENKIYFGLNKFEDLFKIEANRTINTDLLTNYYKNLKTLINISERLYELVDFAYKNPKIYDNRFMNYDEPDY